jgi:Phosphotransferase enzyme family
MMEPMDDGATPSAKRRSSGQASSAGDPPQAQSSRLRSHLRAAYGIRVSSMTELDDGVWLVARSDGPDWVARWFPASRPVEAVAGDAEILGFLAEHDFPAEQCADSSPVTVLDGRGVLVTEYEPPVPRGQRRAAIRAAGGLARLGAVLGRLQTIPAGPGALARPGGAWHHLADGRPSAEVAAAQQLLADAAPRFAPDSAGRPSAFAAVPPDFADLAAERAAYQALCERVAALDSGDGLPEALLHPDFVLANVVATPDGMILVDWSGAGRGPRAWSLAFFLYAEGIKDPRRVDVVLAGYRRHVTLTPEELDRLPALIQTRPLILAAWSVCVGRTPPSAAITAATDLTTQAHSIATRTRDALSRPAPTR